MQYAWLTYKIITAAKIHSVIKSSSVTIASTKEKILPHVWSLGLILMGPLLFSKAIRAWGGRGEMKKVKERIKEREDY